MFDWYHFFSGGETKRVRREVFTYSMVNFSGFYRYTFNGEERIYARVGYNRCQPGNDRLCWLALYPVNEAFQPLAYEENGAPVAFCSIPNYFTEPPCESVGVNRKTTSNT